MREIEVLTPSRYRNVPAEIPQEWCLQLAKLNPKCIVPSSCQFQMEDWSWYNRAFFPISYFQFSQFVKEILPSSVVIRMDPSCSIELDNEGIKPSASLSWIQLLTDASVDYDFHADVSAPRTADIAKKFPPLNANEYKAVSHYCQSEILKKYQSLESDELYFKKPRTWCLSVYDQNGQATDYFYKVHNDTLVILNGDGHEKEWQTEVPLYKLYGDLTNGESLTSMYVRINDIPFSSTIEDEIRDVDVLEDPLVRCLFTGEIGSFQKAQLKHLSGLTLNKPT
jgi:hypothetical protein